MTLSDLFMNIELKNDGGYFHSTTTNLSRIGFAQGWSPGKFEQIETMTVKWDLKSFCDKFGYFNKFYGVATHSNRQRGDFVITYYTKGENGDVNREGVILEARHPDSGNSDLYNYTNPFEISLDPENDKEVVFTISLTCWAQTSANAVNDKTLYIVNFGVGNQ